ncbi:GNAT family N-acetyltransferase [Sandaracinus amylolyticus]|uniref:GNAT family N-acetyltransferase n=1 Tax=Sandaracinus amylolyticus TaxID=927083 RepID=UPI001F236134|nr:N-acetyltransferase [Sandaracinus amylolyticus]UJR83257.1 Hypothetical protein I5071_53240 [Sandaracinus amylolyticus]
MTITVRLATREDEAFLWEMLTHAASMDTPLDEAIASAKIDPNLEGYVRAWGTRDGDVGVIACSDSGTALGAAWLRAGKPGVPGAVVEAGIAELAIATRPDARGLGLGTRMLDALFAAARAHHREIVLSVRSTNPAIRLYERAGFVVEREIVNRVGTRSFAMRRAI